MGRFQSIKGNLYFKNTLFEKNRIDLRPPLLGKNNIYVFSISVQILVQRKITRRRPEGIELHSVIVS